MIYSYLLRLKKLIRSGGVLTRWTIFERKGDFSEAKLGSETYRFNVWVFRVAVFLMVAYFVFVLTNNNFVVKHQFYYSCPDDVVMVCQNPFYDSGSGINMYDSRLYDILMESDLSEAQKDMMLNTETFLPGFSIGKEPDPKVALGEDVFIVILVLSFVLNHFLFNRGFKWRNASLKLEEERK